MGEMAQVESCAFLAPTPYFGLHREARLFVCEHVRRTCSRGGRGI